MCRHDAGLGEIVALLKKQAASGDLGRSYLLLVRNGVTEIDCTFFGGSFPHAQC